MQYRSAQIDITPDFSCVLTGVNDTNRSDGVYSALEANMMVFGCGENSVYLLSIDTLFITAELKQSITELINRVFGQTQEKDIIPIASHTHYAPALELRRTQLGKRDEAYYAFLLAKLESLFEQVKSMPFREVELTYSEHKSKGLTCNRRRKARRVKDYFNSFISMEPNPKGFVDERFKRLNVYTSESRVLVGTLWSFPCHPTNFPVKSVISAEFPGEVRRFVRAAKDDAATVVYLPGLAGDVRAAPPQRRSFLKFLRSVLQLSYPDYYYRFSNVGEYRAWKDELLAGFAMLDSNEMLLDSDNLELESRLSEASLNSLGIKVEGIEGILFRHIGMGHQFAIYTLSAEPVGLYSEIMEPVAKEKFVIFTGYADSVFGYLPAQHQLAEGGYEVDGFFSNFLVTGTFDRDLERTVTDYIKSFYDVREIGS